MNKYFHVCIWVLGLAMALQHAAGAESAKLRSVTPTMLADVRTLWRLNGNELAAQTMADRIITTATTPVDQAGRPLPPDGKMLAFRDSMLSDVRKELPHFLESMERLYASHFTHDELRELIAFYGTTIGRRLAQETPAMSVEALGTGEEWSKTVVSILQRRLASMPVHSREKP